MTAYMSYHSALQADPEIMQERHSMVIGERLRALREEKHLSQGQIEKRSGLLRCYISRVEHGHTIPSVETLKKMCRALEVPLYQLFYDAKNPPILPKYKAVHKTPSWGS